MAARMLSSVIASAIAARSLGYAGVADTILADELTPTQIARLFSLSASPDAGHVAAIVILAAATARFNSCRQGFDGSVERYLAMQLLGTDPLLAAADKQAVKLVRDHWREIAAA
jgi:hypothetical protein